MKKTTSRPLTHQERQLARALRALGYSEEESIAMAVVYFSKLTSRIEAAPSPPTSKGH